jgi:hypothetical protein
LGIDPVGQGGHVRRSIADLAVKLEIRKATPGPIHRDNSETESLSERATSEDSEVEP